MVVSPVESGRSMTRLTMDAHRLTVFFSVAGIRVLGHCFVAAIVLLGNKSDG